MPLLSAASICFDYSSCEYQLYVPQRIVCATAEGNIPLTRQIAGIMLLLSALWCEQVSQNLTTERKQCWKKVSSGVQKLKVIKVYIQKCEIILLYSWYQLWEADYQLKFESILQSLTVLALVMYARQLYTASVALLIFSDSNKNIYITLKPWLIHSYIKLPNFNKTYTH